MLAPDPEFLELLGPLIEEDAEHFEVTPETTWRPDARGVLCPNGFHRRFLELKRRTGRPFIAHGVAFSVGSMAPDRARQRRWIDRMAIDQELFGYGWYTDHLGATSMDGQAMVLPLPLPMTPYAAAVVSRRLAQMRRAVPRVGVENNVAYFTLGDPLDEPAFLKRILRREGSVLLLDLHNVHTMATNYGFDPWRYVDALALEQVIELHLSGGSSSAAAWLPGGEVLRLDSHDHAVPEEVWALLEGVLPRCPNLRAVTLERMEGTVAAGQVAEVREELRRAKRLVELAS